MLNDWIDESEYEVTQLVNKIPCSELNTMLEGKVFELADIEIKPKEILSPDEKTMLGIKGEQSFYDHYQSCLRQVQSWTEVLEEDSKSKISGTYQPETRHEKQRERWRDFEEQRTGKKIERWSDEEKDSEEEEF